jgi:hypothetical protein
VCGSDDLLAHSKAAIDASKHAAARDLTHLAGIEQGTGQRQQLLLAGG